MNHQDVTYIEAARKVPTWTVFVCALQKQVPNFQRALVSVLGPADKFSGRTAVCETGARLSVVCLEDEPFVPEGVPFQVQHVGPWVLDKNEQEGMAKWSKAAQKSQ